MPVQTRRVRDLLAAQHDAFGPDVRTALARIGDRPLYRAVRDALPERVVDDLRWRCDLVWYLPGELPGAEPHRSIGHWNRPEQLEVFQTLEGRVVLLFGSADGAAYQRSCGPGDTVVLPGGAWHVTYTTGGPALVFNAYADLSGPPAAGKYGGPPLALRMRQTTVGPVIDAPPTGASLEEWLADAPLPPGPGGSCLARLFAADDDTAREVCAVLRSTVELGWPARVDRG